MKIYTRRGDRGETDLFGGPRIAKDALRVEAYGAVDELNASVGTAASATAQAELRELLLRVQSTLFDVGAWLATPDPARREKASARGAPPEETAWIESRIDVFEKELAPLKSFILPGGTPAAAALHQARTVCRRAERRVVSLDRAESVGDDCLRYLNRLSDLLFVLARVENRRAGVADVPWVGRRHE